MKVLTNDPEITGEIYGLLYNLNVRASTVAFFHTAYAVRLAAEQPEKLLFVTKWLYPDVAKHYHTNWKAVERNIRAVIRSIWEKNPEVLSSLAQQPLLRRPTASQFIRILAEQISKRNAA